ncbi:MAG: hypothetical protein D6690_00130 [Nitrospirae bacterium]|nr:MAG: hypothetical protein D6690_00130 [Nitrospirota bacterium]
MRPAFIVVLLVLPMMTAACENDANPFKDVQLTQSQSIFLQPSTDKTVYLEIRNASGNPSLTLSGLQEAIAAKGYTLVKDHNQAHFLLQGKVLPYTDNSIPYRQALTFLSIFAVLIAIFLFLVKSDTRLLLGCVFIAILLGIVLILSDTITYTATVDLQITEHLNEAIKLTAKSCCTPHIRTHYVRLAASTDKIWFHSDEATAALQQRLVQWISELLP